MPHAIEIPARTTYWDHVEFSGRRVNNADGSPNNQLSHWAINYGEYPSREDADNNINCLRLTGRVTVRGDLMDAYLLNAAANGGLGGYEMTDARVIGLLAKLLSQSLTESEFADVEGDLARMRSLMAGVPMFGVFTVTELEVVADEE